MATGTNIRDILLLGVIVIGCVTLFGTSVHAQEYDREQYEEWRERWRDHNESEDFDYDQIREWRRSSSETREKIEDLDDDPVEDLPIPILFGVSLDDLYPNFGDPRGDGSREHEGLDMLAPEGTPIVSPTEAVVIRVSDGSSSGLTVTTANPGGETFVYMHLAEHADIDEGDELAVGDVIGYVGDTGNAEGGAAHLHFEIREDREPKNPIERLTQEFSLKEKIEFLEGVLDDVDDEDDFIEFMIDEYRGVFIQARTQGIELPAEIVDGLPETLVAVSSAVPARDLDLDAVGTDVSVLQSVLMAEGHLDIDAPTGYFGPLTQSALAAYQTANGIEPASGYYGPLTRAYMHRTGAVAPDDDANDMNREELIARIAELTELIVALQAQLAERQTQ